MPQFRWLAIVLTAVLAGTPAFTEGAVFIVNSTDDGTDTIPGDGSCATASGVCTLRAALVESNALPGLDGISFGIGTGTRTITVGSAMPVISAPVAIDGWTQPGFAGAPLLVLNGSGSAGSGFTIVGGGTTIRGFVIHRFARNGITISGVGGNVIEGNYIGTDETGTASLGNADNGILIDNSPDNRIGGPSPGQRNVISGNNGSGHSGGILISGNLAARNVVQGNFIGTDATGTARLGNLGRGIAISHAPDNLIGGPAVGAGNLIGANRATGIRILGGGATGNIVQRNVVGIGRNGAVLANDRGVQLRTGSNNQVLGNVIVGNRNNGVTILDDSSSNLVEGNIVAFNGFGPHADPAEAGFSGIGVYAGSGNTLRSNSVFSNALLGIDLSWPYGVSPNDSGDGDMGPNGLQNFPALIAAVRNGSATTITGAVNSSPSTEFTVELFANPQCDPSGYGQGRYPFGQTRVTTDAAGNAAFNISVGVAVPVGWVITATTTDASGDTSEFSACVTVR